MSNEIIEWDNEQQAIEVYKVFDYLTYYIEEAEFQFKNNELVIDVQTPFYIILSLRFKKKGFTRVPFSMGIDLRFLVKILETKISDKRILKMEFDEKLQKIIIYHSRKEDSTVIEKSLNTFDVDTEDLAELIESLINEEYQNSFSITKELLTDVFYENDGVFGSISEIIFNKKGIRFFESGQIGYSSFKIPRNYLDKYHFGTSPEAFSSSYSYSHLKGIKKALSFLEDKDIIKFSINNDHLLKIEFCLQSLNMSCFLFIKPIIEDDNDDDDDMEEF